MISLEYLKQKIIDQKKILDAAKRANQRALSKLGAFTRQRAKSSMSVRKKPSEPGKPPSAHTRLIKDHILFVVEDDNVIIGPMKLNKPSATALSALEHGGQTLVMRHGKPRTIMMAARPSMQPAFAIELKTAPKLWENSIR